MRKSAGTNHSTISKPSTMSGFGIPSRLVGRALAPESALDDDQARGEAANFGAHQHGGSARAESQAAGLSFVSLHSALWKKVDDVKASKQTPACALWSSVSVTQISRCRHDSSRRRQTPHQPHGSLRKFGV